MLLTPFLQQCELRPDSLALSENGRSIAYSALLSSARNVAAALQCLGVEPGARIAVHLDKGIDATVSVFGILLAGASYVPLDLKNPPARLSFIIDDAGVKAVIGSGAAPSWLDETLWLDTATCSEDAAKPVEVSADSLAAILYTSGSTGKPRGVAMSHGAIAAFSNWAGELLNLNPKDRIASSTPFFFDLSTFDLYAALGSGSSLYFVPTMLPMAPARLSAWLKEHAITGWYTVPSLLAFLAYKGNLPETPLENLRFLLFAGEVFPTPALIDLAESIPHAALYNFFGPTETNVCCFWEVDRERLMANENIPIGHPAADCELRIDEESGELWARGPTLASGYWGDGQIKPFLNGEGWYRTGDRASLTGGEYRFHGRLGRMLKCSGYRVEPAEIEAVVCSLSGVQECAVVGIDDPTAGQRPALAAVLTAETTVADIRKALILQLPPYMQPSRYERMESLPRLANGKLDYQKLQTRLKT